MFNHHLCLDLVNVVQPMCCPYSVKAVPFTSTVQNLHDLVRNSQQTPECCDLKHKQLNSTTLNQKFRNAIKKKNKFIIALAVLFFHLSACFCCSWISSNGNLLCILICKGEQKYCSLLLQTS